MTALDESPDQEQESAQRQEPKLSLPIIEDEACVEGIGNLEHRNQLKRASHIEGHASP